MQKMQSINDNSKKFNASLYSFIISRTGWEILVQAVFRNYHFFQCFRLAVSVTIPLSPWRAIQALNCFFIWSICSLYCDCSARLFCSNGSLSTSQNSSGGRCWQRFVNLAAHLSYLGITNPTVPIEFQFTISKFISMSSNNFLRFIISIKFISMCFSKLL